MGKLTIVRYKVDEFDQPLLDNDGNYVEEPDPAYHFYQGRPTVEFDDGSQYQYDPIGVYGPQLLGHRDDIDPERQKESDEAWHRNCSPQARKARDDVAHNLVLKEALNNMDAASIRGIREFIVSTGNAPQELLDIEAAANEARNRMR